MGGTTPTVAPEQNGQSSLLEKVAERETLVTLMSTIDAAVTRKTMILDAMEKFSALLVDRLPFGEGPPSTHVISGYFEKHYAWLRANLEITNRCLETALIHLKIMYGQAYTSTTSAVVSRNENIRRKFVETVLRDSLDGPPVVAMPWMTALSNGSREVGKLAATRICDDNLHDNGNRTPNQLVPNGDKPTNGKKHLLNGGNVELGCQIKNKQLDMQSRVEAAVSLLCKVSYFGDRSTESSTIFTSPDESPSVIGAALEESRRNVSKTAAPVPPTAQSDHLVKQMLDDQVSAEKKLKDALGLLQTEFSALDAAHRVYF